MTLTSSSSLDTESPPSSPPVAEFITSHSLSWAAKSTLKTCSAPVVRISSSDQAARVLEMVCDSSLSCCLESPGVSVEQTHTHTHTHTHIVLRVVARRGHKKTIANTYLHSLPCRGLAATAQRIPLGALRRTSFTSIARDLRSMMSSPCSQRETDDAASRTMSAASECPVLRCGEHTFFSDVVQGLLYLKS